MAFAGASGINYKVTSTTQGFSLLDTTLEREGWFVYGQANGAIAAYAVVKIDDDGQVAELTTAISGAEPTRVGAAQVAYADDEYGWFFVGPGGGLGKGIKAKVAASCAADVKIGTTATAGVIDDTYTDLVQGVKAVTADGGAGSAVEIYATLPMVTNGQD